MLIDNFLDIRKRADEACKRVGRAPETVTVIAVSKTKPLAMIDELASEGVSDFGENYVQELAEKYDAEEKALNWHFIGHLQTNKVKQVIGRAKLIHSADSLHLVQAISKEAEKQNVGTVDILIEINIGAEDTKTGITPEEAEELVRAAAALPHICVRGLMAIAPPVENPEENRPLFKTMRGICEDIKAKNIESAPMDQLSMGMTDDFEVAIEEGATMIRIGTAIFGRRDYGKKN